MMKYFNKFQILSLIVGLALVVVTTYLWFNPIIQFNIFLPTLMIIAFVFMLLNILSFKKMKINELGEALRRLK